MKYSTTKLLAMVVFTPVVLAPASVAGGPGDSEKAAAEGGRNVDEIRPLALKEEMVRDRFQRFEDRVYRLREQLGEQEPDNASRLGRVLQRAGELGLGGRLSELTDLLRDPSSLDEAFNAQEEWLVDADRLLAILLERDSGDEERKREIERLRVYQEKLARILEQERTLRDDSAVASMIRRMIEQLDQAIRRIDALLNRQAELSDETERAADHRLETGATLPPQLANRETDASRDAAQLAEDLTRLGELHAPESAVTPSLESARHEVNAAAESTQGASAAMSEASMSLQKGDPRSAGEQQEQAADALRQAREHLEAAKRELEDRRDSPEMAEQQRQVAGETGDLSDQMRKDAAAGGMQGQPGGKPGSSSPGLQNVDQARREMDDATEALGRSSPEDATQSQDRAVEELEQAQRKLEKTLDQLRKEEREETLRDLELRFREMLSKQRAINEATVRLDRADRQTGESVPHGLKRGVGRSLTVAARWARAEQLQLADLSTQERALSQEAAACLHILDEEGTTIVFPRVVGQLSEDMALVADRLAALDVGPLTQTVEEEIVDTLEQLLEAVQRMQRENEQQGLPGSNMADSQSPLLPPSAELKLLRAGQLRVNTRTVAIESARTEEPEPNEVLAEALRTVARRQRECADIAKEMRDRQHEP